MNFEVNGHVYPRYYLLTDSIYLEWSCFLQTIHEPQDEKRAHFAKMQEWAWKDVERAFGMLQQRWAMVKNPCRQWDLDTIMDIMMCCIILHNMIIEDKQGLDLERLFEDDVNVLQGVLISYSRSLENAPVRLRTSVLITTCEMI
jgi:hypothetical protein